MEYTYDKKPDGTIVKTTSVEVAPLDLKKNLESVDRAIAELTASREAILDEIERLRVDTGVDAHEIVEFVLPLDDEDDIKKEQNKEDDIANQK